jgi:hypothetical protein
MSASKSWLYENNTFCFVLKGEEDITLAVQDITDNIEFYNDIEIVRPRKFAIHNSIEHKVFVAIQKFMYITAIWCCVCRWVSFRCFDGGKDDQHFEYRVCKLLVQCQWCRHL